jgi:hypothetical protein
MALVREARVLRWPTELGSDGQSSLSGIANHLAREAIRKTVPNRRLAAASSITSADQVIREPSSENVTKMLYYSRSQRGSFRIGKSKTDLDSRILDSRRAGWLHGY